MGPSLAFRCRSGGMRKHHLSFILWFMVSAALAPVISREAPGMGTDAESERQHGGDQSAESQGSPQRRLVHDPAAEVTADRTDDTEGNESPSNQLAVEAGMPAQYVRQTGIGGEYARESQGPTAARGRVSPDRASRRLGCV